MKIRKKIKRTYLSQLNRVDLVQFDGTLVLTAQASLKSVPNDSAWPTVKHFASWLS